MLRKTSSKGFSTVEAVAVVLVLVVLGVVGWYVWHRSHQNKTPVASSNTRQSNQSNSNSGASQGNQTADPYAGWNTATSTMAGFTIKYPADWTYNAVLGKDNAEHITIDSPHMHLTVDSYNNATDTKCPDCSQTLSSTSFTAPNLGTVNLQTVTYKLDNGTGNALVLELPDSTYYIPSKSHSNVSTTFRSISVLDSEQTYQAETTSQFSSNSDYKTAQAILKSIAY